MKDAVKILLENINKDAKGGIEFLVSQDTTKVEVFKAGKLQEVVELEKGDDLLEVVKTLKKAYL